MEHEGTDQGPGFEIPGGERHEERDERREGQRVDWVEPRREKRRGSIGEMNGKWGFLFRAVLITTPAFWAIFVTVDLPWRIWVTRTIYHLQEQNSNFLKIDEKLDSLIDSHERDHREIESRFDSLPPEQWQLRIEKLEQWEQENRGDHLKILLIMEAIRARLELPEPK